MKSKHKRTLAAIFAMPTPTSIAYDDLIALIIALGGQVIEGRGSRVALCLSGKTFDMHRPHPQKEIKPYAVRAIRNWLLELGVTD